MKLSSFRVTNFKSIDDSGEVRVGGVTCFVGRNESGKTALFEALAKLNPVAPISPEFALDDFPRRRLNAYKQQHAKEPATAIEATFTIDESALQELEKHFGVGTITEREIAIEKRFNNVRYFSVGHDEALYVRHLVRSADLPESVSKTLEKNQTFRNLLEACRMIDNPVKAIQDFHYQLEQWHDKPLMKRIISALEIPTFFYFSEYAMLPGSIKISDLKKAQEGRAAKESHYTALSFVERIGANLDDFLDLSNYESLKADLESAANRISDEIFNYWTQHRDLELEFSLQPIIDEDKRHTDTMLHIRVRNARDRVSVPFEKRSRGFVWFFSFIVAFSQYRQEGERVILILDEPGHSLHPKAQKDLLRYVEEEISPHHQVLYSTHSPFMIDTSHIERVRVVADGGRERGTLISEEASDLDPEATFALRAALSIELAEGLFQDMNTLLVHDPADVIWLRVMSELLADDGRKGLNERWTVVPAGASGRVAAFVSLLGMNQVNLAIFLPLEADEHDRIDRMLSKKDLESSTILAPSDVSKGAETIADLFSKETWLAMVSRAYSRELDGAELSDEDLDGDGSLAAQCGRAFEQLELGASFSLFRVASVLLRNAEVQEMVDEKSLKNFEKAISKLNRRLNDNNPAA